MNILDKIVRYKREEIKLAKKRFSLIKLNEIILNKKNKYDFYQAIKSKIISHKYALIAEVKKASPSKGLIRKNFDLKKIVLDYKKGGATCLSILTDKPSFQGNSKFLIQARKIVDLPILRKDFILDPYQVFESAAWGADCILIIMAIVDDSLANDLEQIAIDLNLNVLVEVHNKIELERALKLKTFLIGINNRDLKTFKTSLTISENLSKYIDNNYIIISESGIFKNHDLYRLSKKNIYCFLVGESLMRENNVEIATKKLLNI